MTTPAKVAAQDTWETRGGKEKAYQQWQERKKKTVLTKKMAPKGVLFLLTNLILIRGRCTKGVLWFTLSARDVYTALAATYPKAVLWYHAESQSTLCLRLYGEDSKCRKIAGHPEFFKQHVRGGGYTLHRHIQKIQGCNFLVKHNSD